MEQKHEGKQHKQLVLTFCSLLLVLFILVFVNDNTNSFDSPSPFNMFSVLEHSSAPDLTGAVIGIERENEKIKLMNTAPLPLTEAELPTLTKIRQLFLA